MMPEILGPDAHTHGPGRLSEAVNWTFGVLAGGPDLAHGWLLAQQGDPDGVPRLMYGGLGTIAVVFASRLALAFVASFGATVGKAVVEWARARFGKARR